MSRVIFTVVAFLCAMTSFADQPENYPFLPYDEAMARASEVGKPVFIYFGRYGCGYCEKTNKEAFSDPVVRERYMKHYVLAYVDAESGKRLRLPSGERITERELGTRYKAFVTPIFSFVDPDGNEQLRLVGVQSRETLLEADEKVQEKLVPLEK